MSLAVFKSSKVKTEVEDLFEAAEAAQGFEPLPSGIYTAYAETGEVFESKSGTPGYKIKYRVADGEYENRLVWADYWLTQKAMGRTKAELAKFGILTKQQLSEPLAKNHKCELLVVLKTSDAGWIGNEIKRCKVLGVIAPEPDPFAPDFATELIESGPGGKNYITAIKGIDDL